MPTLADYEPKRLTQGDSTQWTRRFNDYLASDGWTLTYYFVRPDGSVSLSVVATQYESGDSFLLTIDATEAAKFTEVGAYLWRAVVTKAAETITVARGRLELLDPLTGSTDRRLWLERMIEALEARMEDLASSLQLSYSIDNRSVASMSLDVAQTVRDRLQAELEELLDAEARANGERRSRAVRVRFWGA